MDIVRTVYNISTVYIIATLGHLSIIIEKKKENQTLPIKQNRFKYNNSNADALQTPTTNKPCPCTIRLRAHKVYVFIIIIILWTNKSRRFYYTCPQFKTLQTAQLVLKEKVAFVMGHDK
jgi:hypothetical protein